MLTSTMEIIKTALKNDQTLTQADIRRIICAITAKPNQQENSDLPRREKRIFRRHEVARLMSVSLRTVDKWAIQGILHKIKLPSRKRACGFLSSEVESLMVSGNFRNDDKNAVESSKNLNL